MRNRVAFIALLFVVAWVLVNAQRRTVGATSVQGVWRVVEQTINDQTLAGEKLGAGFHIYTAGYYAAVRESGVPPRPDIGNVDNATASQLLAVWGPLVSQLGTYEISGDVLTMRTLVAKNPSNMTGARTAQQRFKIEGDVLILEPVERVPGNRQITLKMVRVE